MRTCFCLGLTLLVTTIPAAPAQDADKPLYPLQIGTKWTYQVARQDERFVVTAAKEEKVGEQNCVKLEARLKGQVVVTEHVAVLPDGIYRFKFNDAAIEPALCFCKPAAKKGEKWEVKFATGGKNGTAKFEQSEEAVEVPFGKFKAVVVRGEVIENEVTIKTTVWFAPGCGMVRQVIEIGEQPPIVLELENMETPAPK